MKMVIAGGGTGGHFFPGLAVAEALVADGHSSVLFIGSAYGIEARAVPRTGFPFRALDIRGARGGGARAAVLFALNLPVAVTKAWRMLREFRPQVVVGLGGYGSVPVVIAARFHGIPSVLLEQNVRPGMANRTLARLGTRVCTNFAASAAYFPPGKTEHTGNPVRQLKEPAPQRRSGFTVFAFGGSQGAHTVNQAMVGAVQILKDSVPDLRIVHQTGAADEEWVRDRYREMAVEAEVLGFIEDMGSAYGRADLVVCRAGATTLAELTALGKPAILVPYPYAADDHQRANAEVLANAAAAEMILDAEVSPEVLAGRIVALAGDAKRLEDMGRAARALSIPDATRRVLEVCRGVVGEAARGEI
jgi:UDP-N-acetylglucosamine--N-acetylmuramyl-(pentapeptide) pyrophosphoryl-undecaprenol N-acetylglucosamine transferase